MTEGWIEIGGLNLRYVDAGKGELGLLLLHGGGASLESWAAVLPDLATSARVVAIDRPGWGRSSRPPRRMPNSAQPSPFGPVGEAAIIAELVGRLGLGRPVCVGSSAGGTVALLAALDRPKLFGGLVLVSPGVYSGLGVGLAPGWLVPFMRSGLGRNLGPRLIGNGFKKTFPDTMRKMFHDQSRVTPEFLARRSQEIGIEDIGATLWETAIAARPLGLGARLSTCNIATLVVAGTHDRFVAQEENEHLARALPNLPYQGIRLIPSCGHLPHEEQPEAFVSAVHSFWARDTIPRSWR